MQVLPARALRAFTTGAAAVLTAGLLATTTPAAPAQAVYDEVDGTQYDPTGDGPVPQRDLTWAEVHNDPNDGRFWGHIEVAALPSSSTAAKLRIVYGKFNAEDVCQGQVEITGITGRSSSKLAADGFQIRPTTSKSTAAAPMESGRLDARAARRANPKIGFGVTASAYKGKIYDCFWSELQATSGGTVYDSTDSAEDLTRSSGPLLSVTAPTKRLTLNTWGRVTVRVKNHSGSTARSGKITLTPPTGVRLKTRTIALPPIAVGKTVTKTFEAKMTVRGEKRIKLVTRAYRADTETDWAYVQVAPKPPRRTGSLAGKWFWQGQVQPIIGWVEHEVTFLSDKWAYRGTRKGGLPTKCTRRTASADGPGCVPYWFNKGQNVLQVDNHRGKVTKHGIKLNGYSYLKLAFPTKGKRYAFSGEHIDSFGCPLDPCTYVVTTFKMRAGGSFVHNGKGGRYTILSGSRVKLRYAAGYTKYYSLGFTLKNGRPSPGNGFVFNGSYFS